MGCLSLGLSVQRETRMELFQCCVGMDYITNIPCVFTIREIICILILLGVFFRTATQTFNTISQISLCPAEAKEERPRERLRHAPQGQAYNFQLVVSIGTCVKEITPRELELEPRVLSSCNGIPGRRGARACWECFPR